MRVAIVAPSPNPFVIGAAENLAWGMAGWFNANGDGCADVVKLPVKETSLESLVAGYEAFSRLDMSGFDAVISTRYPAWMVSHPNHAVYMAHRCRGLYDLYPGAEVDGLEYRGTEPAILELLRFMRSNRLRRAALPEFFERFHALAALPAAQPEIARHPGPVGRAVIHFLDGVGLARSAIRRYVAMSEAVARRPGYFPRGADVRVAPPPTHGTGFHDAGEDWKAAFATLLGEDAPRAGARAPRPRVTVLNAYAIHPPDNGGRYRIHWLYRTLARHFDVDIVTLGLPREGSGVLHVDEGLRELRVARTDAHARADSEAQGHAHAPVYDITALENIHLTPDYLTVLENSLADSRLAVLAHPYMLTALRKAGYRGPFIHESQNCELELKRLILPKSASSERLLGLVEEAERFCCREARLVYAASGDDARRLLEVYGGRPEDMIVIPNGADTGSIRYSDAAERNRVRRRLRVGEQPVALFLASGHRPNLEAAERLFGVAERMPDVAFALVGNAADAFLHQRVPRNVWLVGTVSEEARNVWLQVASVALNPMLYGGGTNLKLLDYFAAGTPVVSTEIGIRGTGAEHERHVLVASMDALEEPIRRAIAGGPAIERMTAAARALVEAEFDWWKLGDRLHRAIVERGLLPGEQPAGAAAAG